MVTDSPRRSRRSRSSSMPAWSQPPSRYITSNCGGAPDDTVTASPGAVGAWYSARCGGVPGQHGAHRVEQDQQPAPSRVDHARPGEHVELLLGLLQGDRRRFGRRHRRPRRGPRRRPRRPRRPRPRPAAPRRWCRARSRPPTRRPGRPRVAGRRRTPSPPTSARSPSRSSAASAVTSARPRRICDRMTPELPRAPCNAPSASAAATATTSSSRRESARAHAARMVNSMFVPVSASATGKTLSRLISSVWTMRPATAVCAQSRRVVASSRRADIPPPTHEPPRPRQPSDMPDITVRHCTRWTRFGDRSGGRYPGQVVGSPARGR